MYNRENDDDDIYLFSPMIPQNMFGWIFTNKWCVVACTIQYDDDPICTNRWSKTNLFSYVYQWCIDDAKHNGNE